MNLVVTLLMACGLLWQASTAADAPNPKVPLGKPLTLKFTATGGAKVDIVALKGKVVLIDFWATWCPDCVTAVPKLKAAYAKNHTNGLAIVGISLDTSRKELERFVKKNAMPWPQYFDGLEWENMIATQFGIEQTPTVWLVDKKGVLRYVFTEEDFSAKLTALLAE